MKKTLLSWSSGKDSAWALYKLQQDPEIDLVGLFSTVNSEFSRVAMHATRIQLLHQQAENTGLPIEIIELPYPCTNDEYENRMNSFISKARKSNIECIAFGDLFLEEVRNYREEKLQGTGIKPVFPVWGIPTDTLSREMVSSGLKSIITCVDPKQIPKEFAGRFYDEAFLNDLPDGVDPCGEKGEFHSFVFDGPMFEKPVNISLGDIVHRDGFVFADIQNKKSRSNLHI